MRLYHLIEGLIRTLDLIINVSRYGILPLLPPRFHSVMTMWKLSDINVHSAHIKSVSHHPRGLIGNNK